MKRIPAKAGFDAIRQRREREACLRGIIPAASRAASSRARAYAGPLAARAAHRMTGMDRSRDDVCRSRQPVPFQIGQIIRDLIA